MVGEGQDRVQFGRLQSIQWGVRAKGKTTENSPQESVTGAIGVNNLDLVAGYQAGVAVPAVINTFGAWLL